MVGYGGLSVPLTLRGGGGGPVAEADIENGCVPFRQRAVLGRAMARLDFDFLPCNGRVIVS